MEEVRKRGRPAKVPASNDKPVAAAGGSDLTTLPKKRGRPAKHSSTAQVKKPSSGRGRGRPPKNAAAAAKKAAAAQSGSDDEDDSEDFEDGGEISSEDKDAPNGNDVIEKKPVGRGRPPKAAKVIKPPTVQSKGPTGRGRGRPKAQPQPETISDDEQNSDSTDAEERSRDDDADDSEPPSGGRQPKAKKPKKASKGDNDDSNDDEDIEVPPPAAPSAPGRGRPKKHGLASVSNTGVSPVIGNKRSGAADENGETTATIAAVPKKRGRPALGKTAAKPPVSAGPAKPRGRPKKTNDIGKQQALKKNEDSHDGNQSEDDADNGSDKDESANEDLGNDATASVEEAS